MVPEPGQGGHFRPFGLCPGHRRLRGARLVIGRCRLHGHAGEAPQVRDLKRGLHEFGLEIEAVTVPENAAMAGVTVGEAERRGAGAFFLVQIDRPNGQSFVHPFEDVKIEAGDAVVLVLRGTKVTMGSIFTASKKTVKMGRSYR